MQPTKDNASRNKPRQLKPGEFISRTQKPISKISTAALQVRAKGITMLRAALALSRLSVIETGFESYREQSTDLIAAMNFSVRDAEKELQRRK